MNANYDERLLLSFANEFLGFGPLSSDLWLVGPEAGGGNNIEEVYNRAEVWAERGRKETEDLQSYHAALIPKVDWTQKIQRTWGPLIRIILARKEGKGASKEGVREFQKCELGRSDGKNCVLDLSPLSSRSESHWILDKFGFDWLRTRRKYEEAVVAPRCGLIRDKLSCYKPRLVIFYGVTHKAKWERISTERFTPSKLDKLYLARGTNTLFAVIPHPRSLFIPGKGAVNKFLEDVGMILRQELDDCEPTAKPTRD